MSTLKHFYAWIIFLFKEEKQTYNKISMNELGTFTELM